MSGPWSDYASVFLQVVGIGSLVLLAIPLVVAPLAWARVLRWESLETVAWLLLLVVAVLSFPGG